MAKAYRGVLIGCGWISTNHLKAWSRVTGAEIIALVDTDVEKARVRSSEFGIQHAYRSLAEALSAHTFDFVDIATPPPSHLSLVGEAAAAGLPVLCQKPIAPTLAQLREMIRICEEQGVPFMVNENGRFQPWMRVLKKHLAGGAIGRPFYLGISSRWRTSLPTPNFGGQPYFVDMPRLIIYEMGVHFLDTLRYLVGEPTQLYAQTHRASPHLIGEDLSTIVFQMEGLTTVMDASWASVPTETGIPWGEFKIEGEKGTLHLGLDGVLRVLTDGGTVSEERFPDDTVFAGFVGAQQHFIDCLGSDRESETSGRETLKTMELVFGAYESARSGGVYRIAEDVGKLE